ncbi:hypothetical protein A5661_22960 [Mycobacterium asiaticum]|nr:hypothetical protein A5661_22960 [Mycobacterium asiaticum]
MGSPVDESKRLKCQGVDALMSEKDCVTGGLGELFDAGSDVDGVLLKGALACEVARRLAGVSECPQVLFLVQLSRPETQKSDRSPPT